MLKPKAVVMHSNDNTATVVEHINVNSDVILDVARKQLQVRVIDAIPFGHKFAIRDIAKGDRIIKYGETIGIATQDIQTGRHVHVHNLESGRGRGDR